MNFWNSFPPYTYCLDPNGQPIGYYSPPFNCSWQVPPVPCNANSESSFHWDQRSTVKEEQAKNYVKIQEVLEPKKEQEKAATKEQKKIAKGPRSSNSTRNIKANILRDFVRSVKKDATQLLMAKKILNSSYSIKRFIELLTETFPHDDKYIRAKFMVQLCRTHQDKEFRVLLRVILRNFLKGEYRNFVVLKRKCRFQYLKASRVIYHMLVNPKIPIKDDD